MKLNVSPTMKAEHVRVENVRRIKFRHLRNSPLALRNKVTS